jgi:inner membrane transporter RhtA
MPSTHRPAVLMVLGSCCSLQVGAALAARLFPATGSAGATLLRLGLAAVVLLIVARPAVRAWRNDQWRAVLLLGGALAGMNGFFYAAIARIPLGIAVTIEFLGPLTLAAILSRRGRDFLWVALAAAGVLALGWTGSAASALDPLGVVYVLIAAVFWALYILASARTGSAVAGQGGLAVAMTVGALLLVPSGLSGAAVALTSPRLLLLAAGTALLASVLPYTLELAALRRLPRRVFGILLSLEPAVAALAGWLLLSQRMAPQTAAAITVVVLASVGSTLSAARPPVPVG